MKSLQIRSFSCLVYSLIRTEYGEIRMRQNTDQENSRFGQNSHNAMVSNHTNHRICYFDILAEKILAAGFLSMFVLLVDIKFV